jgi:hypothetical protein
MEAVQDPTLLDFILKVVGQGCRIGRRGSAFLDRSGKPAHQGRIVMEFIPYGGISLTASPHSGAAVRRV